MPAERHEASSSSALTPGSSSWLGIAPDIHTGRFSHTQANGTDVFDMIRIGHQVVRRGRDHRVEHGGPLDYSAEFAVQGWMGSPAHKAIVLSDDYNYVGFGLRSPGMARATGPGCTSAARTGPAVGRRRPGSARPT